MSVEIRVDQSEIAGRTSKQGEIQGRKAFSRSLISEGDDSSGIFLLLKTAYKSVAQTLIMGLMGPGIKYKIKWTDIPFTVSKSAPAKTCRCEEGGGHRPPLQMPRSRTYRTSQNRATRSGRAEDEAGWHDCARCCSFTLVL
jgi:hypothetical protein